MRGPHNIIQLHGGVPILYLASDMGLHYLTFMKRNLENKRKLTPVVIMNNVGLYCEFFVNNVNLFNDIKFINYI